MRQRNKYPKIALPIVLFLLPALLSGCAVVPYLPFSPIMGSVYDVVWKNGEAIKYYAFDLDTTYRAVMGASDYLKLEAMSIRTGPTRGYHLRTMRDVVMQIDILPLEASASVTTVVIHISIFGDRQFVELFYRLVDENLVQEGSRRQIKKSDECCHQCGKCEGRPFKTEAEQPAF